MPSSPKDSLNRGVSPHRAGGGWPEIVSAVEAAVARNPGYHVHIEYPAIASSAIVADMVVEGPTEVIVVELLQSMPGTVEASTSRFAMATMVRESAEQKFPGREVRMVYYSPTKLPESIRNAAERLGAEIASAEQPPDEFVNKIIFKGKQPNIP